MQATLSQPNFFGRTGLLIMLLAGLIMYVVIALSAKQTTSSERVHLLGTQTFTRADWAAAGPGRRGTMVYDLLKSHNWSAMTRAKIEELLGAPTAHYVSEDHLAYVIGPKVSGSRRILVFVHNSEGGGYTPQFIPQL